MALSVSADDLYAQAHTALAALRPAKAETLLRRAAARLEGGASPSGLTAERVLLSLAYVRAERGHVSDGEDLLNEVGARARSWPVGEQRQLLEGLVASQRALLRLRSGDLERGLELLDEAAPRLAESPEDLMRLLLNRGALKLYLGSLGDARADFRSVIELAQSLGEQLHALKARHNLGYLYFLAGDLPKALSEMDAVEEGMVETASSVLAVLHLDRARVRYAAGLLPEADEDLDVAITHFSSQRNLQDQAECELAKAQVALTAGRDRDALAFAGRARRRFERRGASSWALVAHLTHLRAQLALNSGLAVVASSAQEVSVALRSAGLHEDARMAAMVAVRAHVALGKAERARRLLGSTARVTDADAIVTRLYGHRTRAEMAAAVGNKATATRELRAGLRALQAYQSSFGSLDVQTAVVRHGRGLAGQGLSAAVDNAHPHQVFSWSEIARGMASRILPVRPPDDPQAAALLEELRFVRTELRSTELAGRDDTTLRTRRAELEKLVRQRSWYAPGPGDVHEPATLAQLRRSLAAAPRATLVSHMVVGGRVHALVVSARLSRVVALGSVDDAARTIRRVRADLDALAVRGVPAPIRRSVTASVRRGLGSLQEQLWQPLESLVDDGPLLLVPSGSLVATPWPLLPALRGRPIALARSATAWLRAEASVAEIPSDAPIVAAAGPDLMRADEEVAQIAQIWEQCMVLTGDGARGDALLSAADQAAVVHVAAHGIHEAANPLFAALRLADGPLFGYDLARLRNAPRLVVLSSCELGQVTQRPGDEVVGMTAALLHQGVGTVVAAVSKVSDDTACEVTAALHEQLRRGSTPAAALAVATRDREDLASFVAFGRGW